MSALFMTLLLTAGLGLFSWTAIRRWKLLGVAAAPAARFDRPAERVRRVLYYAFGQARMFRYGWAGEAHALIFSGFVVLALRTVILAARGFTSAGSESTFGFWLFDDDALLGALYLILKDLVGLFVIVGVIYFLYVRLVERPRRIELSTEGLVILLMILGLMLADMTYEAAGYVGATRASLATGYVDLMPGARLAALALGALPDGAAGFLHELGFWGHTTIVLAFLNFLPYGKHFHVLTILPQVYFSNPQPSGRLPTIADIDGKLERSETLGAKTARDFSWKAVLDLYTCTECGRCSDHCPATNTGKLLSPKHLSMDLRDHYYRNERALLSAAPAAAAGGERAETPGAGYVRKDGQPDESGGELVGAWVDPEVIWACTTCGACEQECPVFISYIDKIVDLRRHQVMEKGEFPTQLQNAFRGLESVGNVYSFANEQRADWAAGLDIPLLADKPDAEVLYWVGCAPSFDDRARKIARAFATLLKRAGVSFAILGPQETCNGDPARRAGNEYLFQMLAKQNVETLSSLGVRKIVATCPHCFNTLRNEYPDFGGVFEVVHHTVFLEELVRAGRLKPQHPVSATIAYHDACYLGRHNGVYDAPRELLKRVPGLTVVDAPQSRDRGMCCGAGGAQMWKEEEPVRRPGSREGDGKVNHARARQLLKVLPTSGPRAVATACPFCMTMLTDGLRDQGHEDVQRMDVAEVLLAAVGGE